MMQRRSVAGWRHHFESPDITFSLFELIAYCLLMLVTTRTRADWVVHLQRDDERGHLSVFELEALASLHIRENAKDAREATQHAESMLGSIDEFMATANPEYRQIADKRARPVAPSLEGQHG